MRDAPVQRPPSPPGRLDGLDGLRGVLALWVAVTHVVCWCGRADVPAARGLGRVWTEFVFARPAVDAFILLSGFAIAKSLRGRPEAYSVYLARRARRIYPTYLVCLALGVLTVGLTPWVLQTAAWRDSTYFVWACFPSESERTAPLQHLAWHLTLLHGMATRTALPDAAATLLTPAWSVSLEWQFYLVAPTVLRLSRTRMGAAALVAVAALGAHFYLPWANPQLAFLPAKLGLFLIGIGSERLYQAAARHPARLTFGLTVLALCATLTGYHAPAVTIWCLALGACRWSALGVVGHVLRPVDAVLRHRCTQAIGAVSYPLYLVHWPLIILMLAVVLKARPQVTSGEALAIMTVFGLPLILLAAAALHRWVERPLMATRSRPLPTPIPPLVSMPA